MRRLLVALLATVGALAILGAIVLATAVGWLLRGGGDAAAPDLPRGGAVIVADLREALPEVPPAGSLLRLALRGGGSGGGGGLTFGEAVLALDAAARDPRVRGVVARVDETEHGLARAQELRQAVGRLRAAGKFAVAHADSFGELGPGNEGYYLATAFGRVELQPGGLVGLTGIAAEVPFAGRLLADLGIGAEVERRAEYKTALEPFTQAAISPANREMLESIVGAVGRQLVEGVAAGRGLEPAEAERLVAGGPYAAAEARAAGLVDALRHYDEALDAALAEAGPGAGPVPLADYWRTAEAAAGVGGDAAGGARVAFVRAAGLIRRGEGGLGAGGGIAADALAETLADAVDDEGTRAILLRIDSGGGSAVASETIARQVRRAVAAGKPVVVSMGNAAGSGGYWIAAEGTTLLAEPATLTGSIGVVAAKPVLDRLWERLGVTWAAIGSERTAAAWSPNRPYTPEARARIDAVVDAVYADFKRQVARGRGLDPARVEELAKGRVWTGAEAVDLGLVDRIGGLHEALAAVRDALQLPADAPLALETLPRPRSALARVADLLEGGLGSLAALAELGAELRAAIQPGTVASPVVRVR